MSNTRIIARLDVKGPDLIKGIQLEGVRKIGDPKVFARRYYDQGADEILFMDAVASLYDRGVIHEIVHYTAENVFVPITVGGGLRSTDDIRRMLRAGADKVAINTAATKRPELITEAAEIFGSQCVVLQIDAKRTKAGGWEVLCDCGREHTGKDAIEWARQGQQLGAGEILLTSIDREGTRQGFDTELTRAVSEAVGIPVVASGGMGRLEHFPAVVTDGKADAVAIAYLLHTNKVVLSEVRNAARRAGISVRSVAGEET